jgi:hypothetical protein
LSDDGVQIPAKFARSAAGCYLLSEHVQPHPINLLAFYMQQEQTNPALVLPEGGAPAGTMGRGKSVFTFSIALFEDVYIALESHHFHDHPELQSSIICHGSC